MPHELLNLDLPTQKISQLWRKKLYTVEDLAGFFPRKYYDFRKPKLVNDCMDGELCAVTGVLLSVDDGDDRILRAILRDAAGYELHVSWFYSKYLSNVLEVGETYCICGKIALRYGRVYMNAPVAFSKRQSDVARILPVYSKVKGMSNDYLTASIGKALAFLKVNYVPREKDLTARKLGLVDLFSAYQYLHSPKSPEEYRLGRRRMDFEEIYDFYENLEARSRFVKPVPGFSVGSRSLADSFIQGLPFALTQGQEEALETIYQAMGSGKRLEALLTGDVGCGKTMIAMISALFVYENQGQSVVMAPTLVLAKQHFNEFSRQLEPLGVRCGLLTGETKKRERNKLLKALKAGEIDVLIGTHAVLAEDVEFSRLALTVIDEEHKFGVAQKKAIEKMDANGVHHLSMTATPIPRSLAMTVYGSKVQVIQVRTMPKGRKPVITRLAETRDSGFAGLVDQVEQGHQAYIICPFINESDAEQFKNVAAVETVFDEFSRYCRRERKSVRIGLISGDQKQADVLATIDRFAAKELDVLISTTIVEVGVNVPNATGIMIMSAERFGLAALHQLRGRVGRCSDQAYCYLFSEKDDPKFDLFCSTTDGFVIAEEDMKLRGPGNLIGEEQIGYSKAIDLILQRPKMAALVRQSLNI